MDNWVVCRVCEADCTTTYAHICPRCLGLVNTVQAAVQAERDRMFAYWREGFAKHGLTLHYGLTPDRNAAEIVALLREKYAKIAEKYACNVEGCDSTIPEKIREGA